MTGADFLALDDHTLLEQCDIQTYRASGPGGQHRNKVSSAVRLRHRPTGICAHGDERRSQHMNKRQALQRLRINIACRHRRTADLSAKLPQVLSDCISSVGGRGRLKVTPGDRRFWQVAACVLDVMEACQGRLSDAANFIGVTTGSLSALLASERHLLAAAQAIRARFGQRPLI